MPRPALFALLFSALLCVAHPVLSQTPAPTADPLAKLSFLEGQWAAQTNGQASGSGAQSAGSYRFSRELDGHVLARHARTAACKAPSGFDCDHGDLLYVYAEGPEGALKAIYFDSEGHVLHYTVSLPQPNSVEFLTEATTPGPRFRLVYALVGGVMSGRFEMQPPGQTAWRPYLVWSGGRQ